MHFNYNAHVLNAPNGKWTGANRAKRYSDNLRPNHSTKGHQYVQNIHVQKAILHRYEKIIHLRQMIRLKRQYRQQCRILKTFFKRLPAFGADAYVYSSPPFSAPVCSSPFFSRLLVTHILCFTSSDRNTPRVKWQSNHPLFFQVFVQTHKDAQASDGIVKQGNE